MREVYMYEDVNEVYAITSMSGRHYRLKLFADDAAYRGRDGTGLHMLYILSSKPWENICINEKPVQWEGRVTGTLIALAREDRIEIFPERMGKLGADFFFSRETISVENDDDRIRKWRNAIELYNLLATYTKAMSEW